MPAWALFASLLLLVGVSSWRSIADLDYGIHLAGGRWIVSQGWVPSTDPFTWTIADHEYVAYHWLFQVLLYAADRLFGLAGPIALRAAALVATFLFLADVLRRRGAKPILAGVCGLPAILASEWRFVMRPELASTLFLAATIWVVERARSDDIRWLWCFVPIQMLWINTHVFVFGWAVLFFYLLGDRLRTKAIDGRCLAPIGAAAIALFLNPYHYRAVFYPLLLATRLDSDNLFAGQISELTSPFSLATDPRFPFTITLQLFCYKVLLGLASLALIGLIRRRRFGEILMLLVFGALSVMAVRNIPLFVVAGFPAIVFGLAALLPTHAGGKKARKQSLRRRRFGALLVWATAALAMLMTMRVVGGGYYDEGRRAVRFETAIAEEVLAVETADWIAAHDLRGRGYNSLNVGGTLIWRDPSRKIFIDGRNEVSGEEFFRRYLALSRPEGWKRLAPSYDLDYAVIAHRHAMPLARVLHEDPLWRLVHADAVAAVFVRVDGANGHIQPFRFPRPVAESERRSLLARVQIDTSRPSRWMRWIKSAEPPPGRSHHLGLFLLMLGRWEAAERPLLEALLASPHYPETSNNLGALYFRLRRWDDALDCYRRVLALQPDDERAKRRIAEANVARRMSKRK